MNAVALVTWLLAGYAVVLAFAALGIDALAGHLDRGSRKVRTETMRFRHGVAVGMIASGLVVLGVGTAIHHHVADLLVLAVGALIASSAAAYVLADLRSPPTSSPTNEPTRA